MPESLFCPQQIVLSPEGKENFDKIDWIEIIEGETSEEEKAKNA